MICGVEPEVEPKGVVKEEKGKPRAKVYYHFNCKLATAPNAVKEEVSNTKALAHRNGKQGKLHQMATAFANTGRNHKLFKSIEELDLHKSQRKRRPTHIPIKSW